MDAAMERCTERPKLRLVSAFAKGKASFFRNGAILGLVLVYPNKTE